MRISIGTVAETLYEPSDLSLTAGFQLEYQSSLTAGQSLQKVLSVPHRLGDTERIYRCKLMAV